MASEETDENGRDEELEALRSRIAALEAERDRLSSSYNRSLIEASLDPLVTIGPDGKITDVNAATEAATGRSREELIGTDFCDYFTEPAKARAGYQQVFREGSVREYALELRHREGPVISVLYNASVYRDEAGQVIGVFAAARDVTERNRAEEQASRLASIVESSEDAILSKTLEGTITSWNRGAHRIYGYTSEEVIGRSMCILTPPGQLDETPQLLGRVGGGESLEHYETVRRRKDGKLIDVSLTLSPIRDAAGRIVGASTIARDITERRRVEQALQVANRYNRSLLEASVDPLVTIGADGKIMDVNAATEAATGLARGELRGTDFCNYFTEPEKARAGYEQVFREGSVRDYALELRHGDGHVTSVLYNASVYRDEQGRVAGVFAAARDITQRKRAETALEAERQRLFDVLETLPAMICLLTPDYHVAFANRSFREKFGESHGRRCYEYCFGRTEPCEFCESYSVLKTGQPHHWEVVTEEGRVIAAHDFPFSDVDGSPMILEMDLDITEQRRAERALKEANETLEQRVAERTEALQQAKVAADAANVAKSQFLTNMSHELRTPMNAVLGMIDLALSDAIPPAVRDYLETARESADVLLELLNEILDFSRIEAGRFELESSPFDLRKTVEQAARTFGVWAGEKGLELVCEVGDELPPALVGDPLRLRQVLVNLITNAIKFTPKGRIVVRASIEEKEEEGVSVRFAVADTGIGIAAENVERIFSPFTQADASTTRRFGGTGLGLAISQRLVGLMGGRLCVESEVGTGSVFSFTVTLPVAECGAEEVGDDRPDEVAETTPLPREERASSVPVRSLRVLLAEDTPASRKLASHVLQKRGHQVEAVENGEEALALLARQNFDVVLMDVQMPEMDGFQATTEIRKLSDLKKARVPIIAITAHALKGDRDRCLAVGMDWYISKPIDAREMIATVERLAEARAETI